LGIRIFVLFLGREILLLLKRVYILCDSRKKSIYTLFKRKIEKITNKEKKEKLRI
jgi:hypothetical protein